MELKNVGANVGRAGNFGVIFTQKKLTYAYDFRAGQKNYTHKFGALAHDINSTIFSFLAQCV